MDQLIKKTVLTATLLATSLLASSPALAQDIAKQDRSSNTSVTHVSDKVSSSKAKKNNLSVDELDKKNAKDFDTSHEGHACSKSL